MLLLGNTNVELVIFCLLNHIPGTTTHLMEAAGPTHWRGFCGTWSFISKSAFEGNNCKNNLHLFLSKNNNLQIRSPSYLIEGINFSKSSGDKLMNNKPCLGKEERTSFVRVLLKLIDRGQYSKNNSLAETVSAATSVLAYIEPSLVLPHITLRFQLASETVSVPCYLCFLFSFWFPTRKMKPGNDLFACKLIPLS